MRTTIDLPSDLMHAAQAQAAQRGESLNDLVIRAIAREVRDPSQARPAGRLSFPLIAAGSESRIEVTNADLEAVLAAEDEERYGQ